MELGISLHRIARRDVQAKSFGARPFTLFITCQPSTGYLAIRLYAGLLARSLTASDPILAQKYEPRLIGLLPEDRVHEDVEVAPRRTIMRRARSRRLIVRHRDDEGDDEVAD
jgi:hypothetical protein